MYFMTPEKLFINQSSRSFVETLHELNKIKKFVIDEAHCVS
jgi:superfamily II DNA helicase RecQ